MLTRFSGALLLAGLGLAGGAHAQRAAGPNEGAAAQVPTGKMAASIAPAAAPAFSLDSIFINPDVRPQFVGGQAALAAYLAKNLHYPEEALRAKVTGKVYVRFVLSAAGRVTDASVVRGPGKGLNEEALRLVWLMPAWQPAYQHGQAVRVGCSIPIEFQQ